MKTDINELWAGVNDTGSFDLIELYGGDVQLQYNKKLHAYYRQVFGTKFYVPNVTTVTAMIDKSGSLLQWAANSTVDAVWLELEKRDLLLGSEAFGKDMVKAMSQDRLGEILDAARLNYKAISNEATDVGHLAHDWLEKLLKYAIAKEKQPADFVANFALAHPIPENVEAANAIKAAVDWMGRHKFRPMVSERKIYSKKYGYTGTLDWVGYVTSCGDPKCCLHPKGTEQLELGDFKSSKAIYDEYRLQAAAYHAAWEEEFPDKPIAARRILRLGKDDGEFETLALSNEDFSTDFAGFIGTLMMFNWQQQLKLDKQYAKALAKAQKTAPPPKTPKKLAQPVIKEAPKKLIPIGKAA